MDNHESNNPGNYTNLQINFQDEI